ncbi:MAG: ParB/RepB/Spo0J family partition protein [Caulobacterales bacterium]|nr:ParB/RepB/Spo0J family partition protein [Caulobacterales bacterium]
MAENRRGLGRGLSALLGEAEEIPHAADPVEGVRDLPIDLLHRNPDQPRQHFSAQEIGELAESIRQRGVLQPILVRPSPLHTGHFEIIAGERRWRAAQQVALTTIPGFVRHMGDDEALEIAIIENVQREDLNPMEEARAYRALMDRHGYTQEKVAGAVGKSRSHVANTLRLMQLPDPVQEHLVHGRLTAGHARALLSAGDPETLARAIIDRGLTVRDAEAMAKGGAGPSSGGGGKAGSGPRKAKDADTAALEVDLEEALGMGVDIADRGGAGEVRITYASLEQLDEICRRLTRT